jgi:8-oxo-dGTP pyrophosphatase MutT (NUDIX family)
VADRAGTAVRDVLMKNLMVIFERYLSCEGPRLRIGGVVTRDVAHYRGVPHGAVQVAIVALKRAGGSLKPHVLLHWRDRRKKTCPETWDVCGGHVDADDKLIAEPQVWDDKNYIDALFKSTALREANEEFRVLTRPDFKFEEKHLAGFGRPGDFEHGFADLGADNREYSALYAAFVPGEVVTLEDSDDPAAFFKVGDSVGSGVEEEEAESARLRLALVSDLVLDFKKRPAEYADGIARVLSRAANEPGTMRELALFLESNHKR